MAQDVSLQKELQFQIKNIILAASKLYGNEEAKIEAIVCDILRDVVKKGDVKALQLVAANIPDSDPLKYVTEALVGHAEKVLELLHANMNNDKVSVQFINLLKTALFKKYPTARYI